MGQSDTLLSTRDGQTGSEPWLKANPVHCTSIYVSVNRMENFTFLNGWELMSKEGYLMAKLKNHNG